MADKTEKSEKDLKFTFEKGWTIGCTWAKYKGDFSKFKDLSRLLNDDLSAVEYRLAAFDISSSDGKKYHIFYMPGYKAWGFDIYGKDGKITKGLVDDEIKDEILHKAKISYGGNESPFSKIADKVCKWLELAAGALPKIEPIIINGTISVDENKFELLKKYITNPAVAKSIKALKAV